MNIENAIIESVSLTADDHGCLSAWVTLDFGGTHQGFGGYALYLPESFSHHELKSVAGHFIWRVMEIADVHNWSDIRGKTIRVKKEGYSDPIKAIGHIVKDDWFCPSEDFKESDK